jgi:long-chain acyl-CoA synthetase
MQAFHPGIGLLAENLGIPIMPMRMDGVWQMKREQRRLAHIGEITMRIGEPMIFAAGARPETIAQELQNAVAAL